MRFGKWKVWSAHGSVPWIIYKKNGSPKNGNVNPRSVRKGNLEGPLKRLMNIRVLQNVSNLLTGWENVSFWRRTLLLGVGWLVLVKNITQEAAESQHTETHTYTKAVERKFFWQQLYIYWGFDNLEIKKVSGEDTSSGWRKTYRRSPSVTACRKKRQREARRELRESRNGSKDLWLETE